MIGHSLSLTGEEGESKTWQFMFKVGGENFKKDPRGGVYMESADGVRGKMD